MDIINVARLLLLFAKYVNVNNGNVYKFILLARDAELHTSS